MSEDVVLKKIKTLPALPLVAHRLMELMQRDSSSADDVTRVLASDQGLTGRVLRLANSSFYGRSGQVGSVPRAVVLLGFSAIRSLALGLGMAQTLRRAAAGTDLTDFWRHALYVAAGARILARRSGRVEPEEAFVAGLLHDLGRLVLETVSPGYHAQLRGVTADDLLEAEARVVGMAHTRAGQKIVQQWHLPTRLAHVIRFHHHPTQWRHDQTLLTPTVMLADQMARALDRSCEPPAAEPDLAVLAGALGIDLAASEDLLAQTCQEVQRTEAFLQMAGIEADVAPRCLDGAAPAAAGPVARYVYLGGDAAHATWLAGALGIHGWEPVSMRQYLGEDPGDAVALAIIEPASLQPDQLDRLGRLLAGRAVPVAVVGPADTLAATPLAGAPSLPLAVSSADLARLVPGTASADPTAPLLAT